MHVCAHRAGGGVCAHVHVGRARGAVVHAWGYAHVRTRVCTGLSCMEAARAVQ